MPDAYDPSDLYKSHYPSFAVVETSEGIRQLFVEDADVLESGWLTIRCWDRTRFKIPPGRVWNVERVETKEEWDDDGDYTKWIVDESLREKARELAEGEEKVDL